MWSEILWVKPKVEPGDAKRMEKSLTERFGVVTKRFGQGLKAILKGSLFGISLGLISRLLNPLEAIEERIKSLLGEGSDLRDMADRFNTTPGQIKRLQDVGSSMGVAPEQLRELMLKFAQAVEGARRELADPTNVLSDTSKAVKNFTDEKDLAEGFFKFVQSLKAQGEGPGEDVFIGHSKTHKRHASGQESRDETERAVFGDAQFGAAKRFINADFAKAFLKLKEPSVGEINKAVNNTAGLSDRQAVASTIRNTKQFMNGSGRINGKMIDDLEKAESIKAERETKQLESFENLKKAANEIENVKTLLQDVNNQILTGIGQIRDLVNEVKGFKALPFFRNFFSGFKGK